MSNDAQSDFSKVFVTGLGLVTPLGQSVDETWRALLAGRSGFTPMSGQVDIDKLPAGGVCEIPDWDPSSKLSGKEMKRRDRAQQFGAVAVMEAIADAGLDLSNANLDRAGVFMGVGCGGCQSIVASDATLRERGASRISPFTLPRIMPNGATALVAIDYGIQGPMQTITNTCTSGNDAIIAAYRQIRYREIDFAIVGGIDSPLTEISLAAFGRAGALSTRTSHSPRPFDARRDGFVMGEGAAILILESETQAESRDATPLAEIIGVSQSCDAKSIAAPDLSGQSKAINAALKSARITPEQVDYICAHGTGTKLNDRTETNAIKNVYGNHAAKLLVSSTKSMLGHAMGAASAIEAAVSVLAIRDSLVPPTINLDEADVDCDLNYVAHQSQKLDAKVVANHSFGFGGQNAVVIFAKC